MVTKSLTTKCSINICMIWFIPLSSKKNSGNLHDVSRKRGKTKLFSSFTPLIFYVGNNTSLRYDQWTLDRVWSVWNINHGCFCMWGDERRDDNTARQQRHHSATHINQIMKYTELNSRAVAAIGVFFWLNATLIHVAIPYQTCKPCRKINLWKKYSTLFFYWYKMN